MNEPEKKTESLFLRQLEKLFQTHGVTDFLVLAYDPSGLHFRVEGSSIRLGQGLLYELKKHKKEQWAALIRGVVVAGGN
jgi:hypothetical protein